MEGYCLGGRASVTPGSQTQRTKKNKYVDIAIISMYVPLVCCVYIEKYCNHTPLYRQSMILERDIGLEISPSHARWLGPEGRRVADPYGRRDEARVDYAEVTFRRTKPRSMCRCTRAEGRIIKPICGSTADPEEA